MRKITRILSLIALLVVIFTVGGSFAPVNALQAGTPHIFVCTLYESGHDVCRAISDCGLQVWGPYGDGHFEMEQVTCSTRTCAVGHVFATYRWDQCR
jgi:hypothetical protein